MATYTYKATANGYTATLVLTPGAQSVTNNTTVVAYKLTLTAGSSYFKLWPIGWEIRLDGKQVSYQAIRGAPQKSISAGGTITLVSGNVTISHNADGTKAAAIAFRVDGGYDASYLPGTVRYTGSDTLLLPTIPRASGLTLSAESVTLDGSAESVKVTVSAHSSSFRHMAKLTFGSTSAQISLAAGVTSGTISLPMSMLNQIPTTTSGTATVTLTTYSGDTVIGTSTAKLTIVAGASIVPTISAFTATRVGQSALDMYVKGYDKARLRTTAAGVYGSSIRTYEITGGLSGADVTTGVLWTAGVNTWTVKVTDSRGRTTSASVSATVVDYATPAISGNSFERCRADGTPDDDGTYLQVSAAISISPCSGANSFTAKVQYKLQTDSTWTDAGAFTGGSRIYDLGLSDLAYDVRIAVTDKLSTGYASSTIDVGDVIMDYDPDAHQLDLLPAVVNAAGALRVQGHNVIYPVASGTDGIWTWVKYSDGRAECWGRQTINNFKFDDTWGNLSVGHTAGRVDYPVGLFLEPPMEQATAATAQASCWLIISSNGLGLNTATQSRSYNVARAAAYTGTDTLYIDFYCRGRWKYMDVDTWADVQTAVRLGLGPKLFPVGYEFSTRDSDTGQDIIWAVRGHDHHTPASSRLTHSMTLEMKYVYSIDTGGRRTMAISSQRALYYAESALSPGTYNFTIINQDWYPADNGKTFQFTLTKSVPAGGLILLGYANGNANVTAAGKTVTTFESRTSPETLESAVISLGSDGTYLGQTDGTGNVNHFHRIAQGSNNYAQSAVRQWLNSNAEAGGWYQPQEKFTVYPDTTIRAYNGFLHGLPDDFISVVEPAVVPCRTNNGYECPSLDGSAFETGGTYTVTDKFFLLSRQEIFGTAESDNVKDGKVLEYYEGLTDAERKRYDNAGAVTNMWLRSCYPDLAGAERYVSTAGAVGYTSAINRTGVAAACIIA